MNFKCCEACKSLGKKNTGHHLDTVYHSNGHPTFIRLCYAHSVELFKGGQANFITKYNPYIPEKVIARKDGMDPLQNYFVFNSFAFK